LQEEWFGSLKDCELDWPNFFLFCCLIIDEETDTCGDLKKQKAWFHPAQFNDDTKDL